MVKWFNKSAECSIQLINPPKNDKYSPLDKFVNVKVSLKILEKMEKISHISCGVSGIVNVEMMVTNLALNGLTGTGIAYELVNEPHLFFNCFDILLLNDKNNNNDNNEQINSNQSGDDIDDDDKHNLNKIGKQTYTLFEGDELSESFEFEIPNTVYLPSSCERVDTINGNFDIDYNVFVEIYKVGGLFFRKPKLHTSFTLPIKYQAEKDLNLNINNKVLNYGISKIFRGKIKKFYYNEETNSLIPNSMNKNHNKTKFLRQIWNDNYKDKNYNNLTKSIPLKVKFSINSLIDLQIPLFNQLNICLLSNLKSIGIKSNQSNDFVFNDQSTNLGLFQINSLTIEIKYKTDVNCKKYVLRLNQNEPILKITFSKFFVDIKDFKYNRIDGNYIKNIDIETLIEHSNLDLTKNFSDLLGDKTIITSGTIPNWFNNTATFKFTLEISDGISQYENYEFVTSSTPDILLEDRNLNTNNSSIPVNNSANHRQFPPPPTYENSKLDKKLLLPN